MPHFLPHYIFFPVISEALAISSEILHKQFVCDSGFNPLRYKNQTETFQTLTTPQAFPLTPSHHLPQVSCSIRPDTPSSVQLLSEQVWQNETWRFWLHTVDPEICTACMVLVPPIRQLKVIRFRIKGFSRKLFHRFLFFFTS